MWSTIIVAICEYNMRKSGAKKSAPRRRFMRRARKSVPRALATRAQFAKITETLGSQNVAPNTYYYNYNVQLVGSARAMQVAQAYQFYRISNVTYKFKPVYDTFVASGAAVASVPQLYWRIDREANIPTNSTLNTLKATGCKPRRLDDKIISISFKPAVSLSSSDNPGVNAVAGPYKVSPWLPTQNSATNPGVFSANSVDHRGLVWYVDMGQSSGIQTACQVEIVITYEFKNALWTTNQFMPEGTEVTFASGIDVPPEVLKTPAE